MTRVVRWRVVLDGGVQVWTYTRRREAMTKAVELATAFPDLEVALFEKVIARAAYRLVETCRQPRLLA